MPQRSTIPFRVVASLAAGLLLAPLLLPLAAHAATAGPAHHAMNVDMEMDMVGDLPCPPQSETVSTCCLQSGLAVSAPAVPQRQTVLVPHEAGGSLVADTAQQRQLAACRSAAPDRYASPPATAPRTSFYLLHASFLL